MDKYCIVFHSMMKHQDEAALVSNSNLLGLILQDIISKTVDLTWGRATRAQPY